MSIEETLTRGVLGLLSFIFLIAWLRWVGPPEDQEKDEPPQMPSGRKTEQENGGASSRAN